MLMQSTAGGVTRCGLPSPPRTESRPDTDTRSLLYCTVQYFIVLYCTVQSRPDTDTRSHYPPPSVNVN